MKIIQWFPGHMSKTMREITENAKLIDGVIYVLDARAPFSCINFKLNSIFDGKPIVYAVNKSDLIEKADENRIFSLFKAKNMTAKFIVGSDKKAVASLLSLLKEKLSDKIERNKIKGNRPLRIMVIGVPNTGKSTIINSLCGQKRANTGDKAGVTKRTQWLKISGLEIMDTPGTMPPSFENQEIAKKLAFVGCINDDILDKEEICLELIKSLKEIRPEKLTEKYKVNVENQPLEIYEEICRNRGYLSRGGQLDYERCASCVIDDFRKARIGKICLE